eukprot:4615673-Amphidinium_carterae.1
MQYLAAGQPLYAGLTSFGLLMDPLGLRAASVVARAWCGGWRGPEFFRHRRREGFIEGRIGTCIAFVALTRTPVRSMQPWTFITLLLK